MASFSNIQAKLDKKYAGKEEEKKQKDQNSQNSTTSSTSNSNSIQSKLDKKYGATVEISSDYISSFFKDAQSYLTSVESDYNGMTFNNSSSVYEQRKKKTEDLKERSWNIRQYLDANKDSIGEDSYNSIIANLDEFDKYSTSNDYSFYRKNKYFSQWDSEDAYKTGIMSSAEIKHEYDNRVAEPEKDKGIIFELSRAMVPYDWETAEANGVDRQTWEDIEEKRQYINQKYGVNLHESGYDDINVLNNLYKTLDENDSSIAYTTKDGQNVTWQMLYDQKVAQEDLANRIAEYSGNDDWGEMSKGKDFSADPNRESDYNLVWELSLSNIAYDKETALANGTSEAEWNDIDRKRRYIGEKYGVDLYSDIYSNTNIFNEIMTMLDDKSWESGELSTQLHEDVIGEQTFTNMRHLTKDEKAVLNYIFNTQGRDAALQWHNSRMNVYQNRANGALTEEMIKAGQDSPFWSSVGSVALNLGSSVEYLVDIFDYMATGEAPNNILSRASSSIRSGVQETIDSDLGDFVYSTFMSGVDSYVASFLPGGFLSLGLSAAAQATNDALDRGAPVGRAVATGIAAGIFEGLFEKVSISKFKAMKEVASAHGKDIAMNIVKSVFTNASEEFATEVANIAFDSFVNGDFSQYETTIRQYMAMGYSEKDAKTMAAKDLGAQVGEAALSGALMGAGFGFIGSSGAMANNANNANKQAARTYNIGKATLNAEGGVDALQALAMDVSGASDSKLAKKANKLTGDIATGDGKIGKAVAGVKNMAQSWKTGQAYRAIESTISDKNKTDLATALKEKGLSEKSAKNLSEAIVASLDGKQLTHFQRSTLELFKGNSKIGEAITEAFNGADSSVKQRIGNLSKFNLGIKFGVGIAPGDSTASTVSSKAKAIEETSYEVSEGGKTILDGTEVKLNGLRKMEDGSVVVATADNQTADPSDVQYPSEGHALIYENYANIDTTTNNPVVANMDVEDRSALAMAFDPASGVAAKAQFLGLNHAYWYGFEGMAMDEKTLPANSYIKDISDKQRTTAYELGRKAAEKAAKTQKAGLDAAYEKAVEKLGGEEKAKAISKKKSGNVILGSGIKESSMTLKERASYEMAKVVAKSIGTDIHIYRGMKEYGKYSSKTGDIWLNINANISGQSMMAFTLGHELVHMAKQWSSDKFKAFADYLLEQYGKKGISVEALIREQIANAKLNGYTLDEHEAYEEVIADACQRMLLDSDAVQKMAAYKEKNPSQWQQIIDKIKEFIDKIRKAFAGVEPDSNEAALFKDLDDFAKNELEKRFVDMVMDAGEHLSVIRAAFGKGTVVEVNADGEFTLAKGKDSNGATKFLYNDYTWEKGGRDTLSAALKAEGFSEDDINAALTIMDGKHKLVKELAEDVDEQSNKKFPEQARINQATITTDLKNGHSVLSALVSNGDYPVNIDLLMVCKKRKAYQRVINRLCETGMIQQATVDALAIAEINKILGKYGFETACLGCFVESRRLRIQEWAETIVKEWNSEVKKRNPNAKAFGFGKGEATLTTDEVMQLVGELESHEKNDKGNLNLGQGSAVKRMGVLLDKVPSLRKTLSVEDLITPDGLSSLRSYDSNLFSMVKSRYGSNSPKFVQEFNPYNHELAMYGKVPSEYKNLREYLYAIGGARMQSFSDFIVENWFDYCQIVADLAARKLPMHTYTKEIALAKLFGLTGIKINMSLIPDIDRSLGKEFAGLTRNANGELELIWADKDRYKATGGKSYMQSINFADAIALQNDPRYSANVGTIAVGVSDNHILMMLDDNRIRMIIPYHSSGMNPIFADLMGTSYYKDYTMVQNTTVKQLYNSKGQPVSLKLEKTQNDNLVSGFQFNAVLQELGDARAAAEAYKDWCADASKHTITIKGETYTAELTPKFNDFSGHENYYKLLEDFNTYDCISEQAAQQGDVQQIYPEDFDKILKDELTAQENNRQKQEANQSFDKAMGEIESYLSTHTKADTVFYAEQHGIKLGAKDKKLGAADKAKLADLRKGMKMSMPKVDSEGRQLSAEQQEFFKDSQVRWGENLMPVYHGTRKEFTVFDATKGYDENRVGGLLWAAKDSEYAEGFTYLDEPLIMKGYLNITNLLDVGAIDSYDNYDKRLQEIADLVKLTPSELEAMVTYDNPVIYDITSSKGFRDRIVELGYDGVEAQESGLQTFGFVDSNQFKNIDNKKPTTDPDIRYSMPKKRTFTYNELVARGSITGEVIKSSDYVRMKAGLLDEDWLVKRVIRDCKVIQTRSDKPTYYAEVPDIGRNVQVTSEGILHGGGNYKKNNKGVLPPAAVTNNKITVNLVNILRTAIEVNRSRRGSNIDNPFTHIMLGVAGLENADGSVDYYGVRIEIEERVNRDPILVGVNVLGRLKGVNAKKISSPHAQVTDSAGVALATGSFAYNIADLLKDVKKDFDDTFSVDVYRKLKIFRKKNDFSENLLFKAPNSHGMSPRQLLADAFDELVQTPDERKLMDEYRNNISKVEGVQERLRKLRGEISKLTKAKGDKAKIAELNKTAKELAELIDKYDRKLLDLEASKPLKDVLARARAAAYQEARQRSEKDLKEYRQQVSERFDRGVENRRKTEMRNKIRRVIRDLDKILNRGDKKRNVKEDMKDFVAEALASAEVLFTDNYTNEDIVRNGFGVELSKEETKYLEEARKYMDDLANLPAGGFDAWQARQEAEEQLKSKLAYRMSKLKDAFFRERQRLNKAEVAEVLGNLADAYAKLETSEYAYVNGAYHEAVYEYLKMLQEDVGGAKIKDMTIGQLEEMYKAYTMVLTTVQNANKMFAEDLKQSKEEIANRVMMEVYQAGGEHGLWSKGQLARNQASWNNTKPIYAAERTGSSTFVKLVKGLFKGQYNWATDMEEAKAFRQKVAEKYGFKDWDMEKTYKFTSSSGIEFELNLNQIMSLYAYAKREQAHDHLLKGGFVFGKNTEVVVTKNGIKRTYLNKSAKAHNISDEIMGEIVGKLSNEQKGFVDEMQDYLSTTMGDKGNDVSMRLYGVTLFKERFYFPLRSAGQFKEKAKEAELKQQQGHISIANSGFTKAITPKASNPVVLDGFTDVWAGHVNEMSLYHSMVLPMEDFRRVYNYASPNMEGQESASVNSFIENAYGDAATGYFDQLYKELNGGAIVDPRENLAKQMIGRFKKSAVMLSNSVWVQQFSAIGRSIALIDPKYFVGQKVDKKRHAALWAEMKQYAPVAIIKEMGGFDTHTGLSAKDYLLSEEYGKGERIKGVIKDKQYRDELMGLLPAKADELTWCAIWEAVKRETKAKNPTLDVKSEEFLKKAGERFSDIIEKTQVYDSVLARSANMRSKQGLMQMLTAFMAEPTTTVNMIEDALRKGDKKTIARTFGAAAVSIILNNALASIVYAMRDDDEDETFLEKYAQAFASGMLDDINPMTYYPILKDIWSLLQGYDVERTDMAIYSDIADSLKKVVTLISKYDSEMDDEDADKYYKDVTDALMSLLDAGASAFGIPWKNVRRDLMSYYNTFNTFMRGGSTTWNSFVDAVGGAALDTIPVAGWVAGESDTDKLYDAIISGDTVYVDRLKSGYKDEDAYSTAVRKALRDNDPRVKEAALAQINGNPSERVRIAKLIMEDGFSQDDVVRAINAEVNAMTSGESTSTKKEKGFYTAKDFAREISNGDQAAANAARSDIIETAQKNGMTREKAEESFVSSAKSEMGELYTSGNISVQKLTSALKTYCDMDDDEVYWQIDKWDYAKATGSTDGYGKYNDFHAAVQTGKDLKTVIKTYTDNGVEAKTLASEITSHFKPLYREMSNSERASIKGYLLNAYALLGYDRSKKSKDIDKWLED